MGDVADPEPTVWARTAQATVTFPVCPASAQQARNFMRTILIIAGLDDPVLAADAQLLTSELVTQVILRRWRLLYSVAVAAGDGAVVVRVSGHELPHHRRLGTVRGRADCGVVLLQALADSWGSEGDAAGGVVWFRIRRSSDT